MKKINPEKKRLQLGKERIRELDAAKLGDVAGGRGGRSEEYVCTFPPTSAC